MKNKKDDVNVEQTNKNVDETNYSMDSSYEKYNSDKTKLMIMGLLFIVISVWVISIRDVNYDNSLFNKNNNNSNETQEPKDNFENYTNIINSLATKSYEYTYIIEPDKESDYFYLRGSVEGNKKLYYKEWKNKEYVYLQKGNNFYIAGAAAWKKSNKELSYEGYDTTILNTNNLYKLLTSKESYENKVENNITVTYAKIDLNKLIDIYNDTVEIENTIKKPEDKTNYLTVSMFVEKNTLNINLDLKDFYKLVYGKEYNNIYYSLEFKNVGSTSLAGVEDFSFVQAQ